MKAVRLYTYIGQNHELIIQNLPFNKGQRVEVIILEDDSETNQPVSDRFPLRDQPIRYDDPFSNIASSGVRSPT